MAAGDVPDGKGHREHGQPERKRNAEQADADVWKCRGEYRTSATAKNKPERSQELSAVLFHLLFLVCERILMPVSGALPARAPCVRPPVRRGMALSMRKPTPCPVRRGASLGLRFLGRFRLARAVERDRLANERLDGGLVDVLAFVDVDRAAHVSVEAGVEETGRILQGRAFGEGELHDALVGFARADDAVVRPDRSAHPLPLLDDVRVRFLDELAHPAEGFPAPVRELGDSFRDELRYRPALPRARLVHVLIPEVPEEALRQLVRHEL